MKRISVKFIEISSNIIEFLFLFSSLPLMERKKIKKMKRISNSSNSSKIKIWIRPAHILGCLLSMVYIES